jgi:uncharacterized protein YutE (UPF0331/DUF86 family)
MTELDNIDKVTLRLQKLEDFVGSLKSYQGITVEKLETDKMLCSAIERQLELACESVLDIARLIVADQRLGIPEDSKGYILVLGKAGILDADFANTFASIAGFRNILVHMYLDIDYGQVVDKINNRLGDFEIFSKSIAKYYEFKR